MLSKEDIKKQKEEERLKEEQEIKAKITEYDNQFKEIKYKKEDLLNNFVSVLKSVLSLWRRKIKNEKILDEVYLTTARMIEFSLNEKNFNYFDLLNEDEKADIVKFMYITYDRFSRKLNCLTLKPAKLFNVHQEIIAKQGVGIVHRAMFSIQK